MTQFVKFTHRLMLVLVGILNPRVYFIAMGVSSQPRPPTHSQRLLLAQDGLHRRDDGVMNVAVGDDHAVIVQRAPAAEIQR